MHACTVHIFYTANTHHKLAKLTLFNYLLLYSVNVNTRIYCKQRHSHGCDVNKKLPRVHRII